MNKPSKEGGPGTFQNNFEKFLRNQSLDVIYPEDKIKPDLIFIISGTRRLLWLFSQKISGVKVLQRLDGMNWKFEYERVSFKEKIKQRLQNLLIAFIRRFIADHVIYQSKFIEKWWNHKYGIKNSTSIIINGTEPFENFTDYQKNENQLIITCIEGNIQNDKVTISILNFLNEVLIENPKVDKIEIYGDTKLLNNDGKNFQNISFQGHIPREKVKGILSNNKRIFFLLELNPPCPNSLIEAISVGLPCIGFDTGSFKELLGGAGKSIFYDANVWKLEIPDFSYINEEVDEIIDKYEYYKQTSLEVSKKYKLEKMLNDYFQIIDSMV